MKIKIFSAHCELQEEVSARRAQQMLAAGDAVPHETERCESCRALPRRKRFACAKCGGCGVIVLSIRRVLDQTAVASPAAITAREMERAAGGEVHARRKVAEWPWTGVLALRHAQ
ncbi:MAG TPA: hypothetical protein VN579_03800 [Bryobacteraceae bacterium]|nr:hypothetical protein [Bryobacteraceae bacterium]